MTKNVDEQPILVLGGTGKTGRRVVDRLVKLDRPVRVGSRSGEPPFDWTDRRTWASVLDGVSSVYLVYYPDLAAPDALATVRSFTEQAVAGGIERLVLLSGRGEEEAELSERTVQDSGVAWTIVRASWFSQNFSEDFLTDSIRGGEVVLPAGNVPEPFVDAHDIADIVVAALTGNGHAGQLYEVTGPRLLTFAEATSEIGDALGREIRYRSVSPEEYAAVLAGHDVPAELAAVLTELFGKVLDGRNAQLTDGVQRALGRRPRDFTDYARSAAAAGAWDTSPGGNRA
ncbi:NAD(P)H-binding protein [Micromonospora inaquosa]|uniref:NmrA family transcriptional regulator n=1 Tax=Micromonospora inaquosa TaxID=2203716 RepID=A0A3N9WTX2_9ACTN|nr:NAD(P)H-binding protein [Micromonospora inaquosa]RQX04292.1 NmrA family transcriptional regulator [Micromonospora inaquosa]